jgi:chromosome segregation ATPase
MFRITKDPVSERILHEIERLSTRVAELRGEREHVSEELGLSARIASLQREATAKEIELDRVKEQHAREKREVEHMVGLHRKKVEQEIQMAKRETQVTLREETLKADRERFEAQMTFMQTRMETELERLNALTSEILGRLPKVTVDRQIREHIGAPNGNYRDTEDDHE